MVNCHPSIGAAAALALGSLLASQAAAQGLNDLRIELSRRQIHAADGLVDRGYSRGLAGGGR